MTEYHVSKAVGVCSVSGREICAGEYFYTALFENQETLERRDFAAECWQGSPAESVCSFRTRIAEKADPKRTMVDDQTLVRVFQKLAASADESKRRFQFVVAMLLMRKRVLKYEGSTKKDGQERWKVRLIRDGGVFEIENPNLTEDALVQLYEDLTFILGDAEMIEDDAADDSSSQVNDSVDGGVDEAATDGSTVDASADVGSKDADADAVESVRD